MAKIPVNIGGGGGTTSDDCTAVAADVLTGKTAIYNGSDDEAANGAMTDKSGTTSSASITANSSNARMELTVPDEGKYDTNAKLYTSYSNLASASGLTAAKIATGNTVAGVTGSYTGVGTAAAAQVLSGYTFSNASLSGASGSMTDKSGSTSSASSSLDSSNSRVRLQIPANAYYNTSAYLYASYGDIASLIGLTAAKIKKGTTILGVTGTYDGKDYGGDTPELIANGYIDKYGYTGTTHSTLEGYANSQMKSGMIRGAVIDASTTSRQYFSTTEPFDGRGYNYMVYILRAYISTTESSSSPSHNFQINPFVSFATAPDTSYSGSSKLIEGDVNSRSKTYNNYYSACTFVDLTNCTSSDLYMRVGLALCSSWDNSSQNAYGYVYMPSSAIVQLFRDKSQCTINGSDYDYSWTLTY